MRPVMHRAEIIDDLGVLTQPPVIQQDRKVMIRVRRVRFVDDERAVKAPGHLFR
ncbi:hypothetical protein [Ruegeria sp. THAF33]|uniref:hypothetical protein n=1 Tax=Ruegeria sp. THAF33 TaxID=2587853 RepID=UPI0020C8228C|nr:hypothetical protein [Ruegeria sp. THAF33]